MGAADRRSRCALGLAAALGGVLVCVVRGQAPPPIVHVRLSHDLDPSRVQIRYQLRGRMGGFGSFVRTASDTFEYSIPLTIRGAQATQLDLVAYSPGCRIAAVVVDLPASAMVVLPGLRSAPGPLPAPWRAMAAP